MLSSVERQDSLDSLDSHISDGLLEAPTLSSKEIERAREQALKILKTKSPEEAFNVFTKGSEVKPDLPREKTETLTMPPPKGAGAKANSTVSVKRQPPPKN